MLLEINESSKLVAICLLIIFRHPDAKALDSSLPAQVPNYRFIYTKQKNNNE